MTIQRTIPAGEFKAKCLKLMDEIAAEGGEIVITKRGKPFARLVPPAEPETFRSFIGSMKGTVTELGDIVSPIPGVWDSVGEGEEHFYQGFQEPDPKKRRE